MATADEVVQVEQEQVQPHLLPLVQAIAIALHARTQEEELWATQSQDLDRVMDALIAINTLREGAEERVLQALPVWAKRGENGEQLARIAVEAVLGAH